MLCTFYIHVAYLHLWKLKLYLIIDDLISLSFLTLLFGTTYRHCAQYNDNIRAYVKNGTSFRDTERFDKIKFPQKRKLSSFNSYL